MNLIGLEWSRSEKEQLVRMWKTHSIVDIAAALGRSQSAVKKVAKRMALSPKPICWSLNKDLATWTPERDEHLRAIYNDYAIFELAEIFESTENGIRSRATRLGLARKRCWTATSRRPEPPGELEIAPGHFAVDWRSYELLTAKRRPAHVGLEAN